MATEMSALQAGQLQVRLADFLNAPTYHRLCLIICPDIRRLAHAGEQIQRWYRWPTLSVGASLAAALLPVSPGRRSAQAAPLLTSAIEQLVHGPLLCTEIDLLFEPTLQLNPLRLLRDASRQAPLVVLWPGSYRTPRLAYATVEHAHYRLWQRTDLPEAGMITLSA